MRPEVVAVVAPEGKLAADVCQAVENLLVQAFVAQAVVEALDESVLLLIARVMMNSFGFAGG
jgi:hypothetical protein